MMQNENFVFVPLYEETPFERLMKKVEAGEVDLCEVQFGKLLDEAVPESSVVIPISYNGVRWGQKS